MTTPKLLLVPSAVPTGYAGEPRLPVFNADYANTYPVVPAYGPPSLFLGAAVEAPDNQAGYWPHVDHQAYNQFLHTVVSAQAPAIPARGANRVRPGARVAFRGPHYFNAVKAPSINEVERFMAGRGPAA